MLANMTELRILFLWSIVNARFSEVLMGPVDLNFLQNLTKMEDLSIKSSDVTDDSLNSLRNMRALKSLSLTGCSKISDKGIAHLDTLTNLESMFFPGCNRLTDTCLVPFQQMANMKKLSLSGCGNITNVGITILKNMTSLRELSIGCKEYGSKISDAGLPNLYHLRELKELRLDGCDQVMGAINQVDRGWGALATLATFAGILYSFFGNRSLSRSI